ncbi:hypothetical protein OIV83_005814 [Microbotryomycetes sp. JL201]|nr:hypothetical protein OIV83_005814 [Microbotryomycetes sp. JL201]
MSQRLRTPLRQWARQVAVARQLSTAPAPQPSSSSSSSSAFLDSMNAAARPSMPRGAQPSGTFVSSDGTFPAPRPSVEPTPDAALLANLARLIMRDGKLARAHSHIEEMLGTIQSTVSSPPMPVLTRALEIASPEIRIVGRRKGTKSLPTPQPLTSKQRTREAWKWIVEASDKRLASEKNFGKRLAQEVLAVIGGQSEAIKKKEARHQQGVQGRANVGR